MAIVIIIWIICGIGAAIVAQNRGASGCLWFGLGFILGPFGLAFAFLSGSERRCPRCMERIHPQATRCPKCQSYLGPSASDGGSVSGPSDDPRTTALINSLLNKGTPRSVPAAEPIHRRCNHCGAELGMEARWAFCASCGQPISAER